MTSMRDDIAKEKRLAAVLPRNRTYIADGLRAKEVASGSSIIYCPTCRGPVVDSDSARRKHAIKNPRCAQAMESK